MVARSCSGQLGPGAGTAPRAVPPCHQPLSSAAGGESLYVAKQPRLATGGPTLDTLA